MDGVYKTFLDPIPTNLCSRCSPHSKRSVWIGMHITVKNMEFIADTVGIRLRLFNISSRKKSGATKKKKKTKSKKNNKFFLPAKKSGRRKFEIKECQMLK